MLKNFLIVSDFKIKLKVLEIQTFKNGRKFCKAILKYAYNFHSLKKVSADLVSQRMGF